MTIYYECGIPAVLIPVQFLGWAKTPGHSATGLHNAVVRLRRSGGGYRTGEVLHVPASSVVEKAGRRDHRQLVRPAFLPAVDPAFVLPSRWQ